MQVKKRTLADLFKVGMEFTLDDGTGEGVTVYLQKLNPVEVEMAVRKANGVRAQFMGQRKDRQSEAYLSALNEIVEFEDDELANYLAADELARKSAAFEAEWAEENEWTKDDYLQSLFDRWNEPGVQERFFVDEGEEPDPESKRLFEEMQRYTTELQEHLTRQKQHFYDEFSTYTRERLQDMIVDRIVKMQGDLHWMIEYHKSEIWLGVHDPHDHSRRYFDKREEVDALEKETLGRLIDAYAEINVEVDEGKGSEVTLPSSSSSELPEEPEAADSSTPVD